MYWIGGILQSGMPNFSVEEAQGGMCRRFQLRSDIAISESPTGRLDARTIPEDGEGLSGSDL